LSSGLGVPARDAVPRLAGALLIDDIRFERPTAVRHVRLLTKSIGTVPQANRATATAQISVIRGALEQRALHPLDHPAGQPARQPPL